MFGGGNQKRQLLLTLPFLYRNGLTQLSTAKEPSVGRRARSGIIPEVPSLADRLRRFLEMRPLPCTG